MAPELRRCSLTAVLRNPRRRVPRRNSFTEFHRSNPHRTASQITLDHPTCSSEDSENFHPSSFAACSEEIVGSQALHRARGLSKLSIRRARERSSMIGRTRKHLNKIIVSLVIKKCLPVS